MKIFKKLISMFLALIIVVMCTSLVVSAEGKRNHITDYSVGDTLEFGYYPQTKVTDSTIIATLNLQGGEWVSYKYYSDHFVKDYMFYKDVTLDGCKYRGIKMDLYRPSFNGFDALSTSSYSHQHENGYCPNNVYWFKYEPLEVIVLNPSKGLVLCKKIIDAQPFLNAYYLDVNYYTNSFKEHFANNYEYSSIRKWLNEEFYNVSFTNEKKIINSSEISNESFSGLYPEFNSNNTIDKVFLLSCNEINEYSKIINDECLEHTDYSLAQGLAIFNSGDCVWGLRTAYTNSATVCLEGVYKTADIDFTGSGIRPAFCISPNANLNDMQCLHENTVLKGYLSNSCVTNGYTGDALCLDCDKIIKTGSTSNALGHNFGEWKVTTPATTTSTGVQTRYCSRCTATETKSIPMLTPEEPTSATISVEVREPVLFGKDARVNVTVSGSPSQIRFEFDGTTKSVYRDESIIEKFDDYEVWHVSLHVFKKSLEYKVHAKYGTVWSDNYAFFTLECEKINATVTKPAPMGGMAEVKVTVSNSPITIRFEFDGTTKTVNRSDAEIETFDTYEVWTTKLRVFSPELFYRVHAKYEAGWSAIYAGFYLTAEKIVNEVTGVQIYDITMNSKDIVKLSTDISTTGNPTYTVKYESSNPNVASVDENGNVTAGKKGVATITCYVTDGNNNTVKDECAVTVKYTFIQVILNILTTLFGIK